MTRPSSSRFRPLRARAFVLAGSLLLGAWWATPDAVRAVEPGRLVLVAPFENSSGVQAVAQDLAATGNDPTRAKRYVSIDRYAEAPRAVLEEMLRKFPGVWVVDHQRVDMALLDRGFARLGGLEKARKLGTTLGAQTVVTGTILDVRNTSARVVDDGEVMEKAEASASIRVQIIEVAGGSITFSKVVKGSQTFPPAGFGGIQNGGVARAVVQAVLEKLSDDEEFRKHLRP